MSDKYFNKKADDIISLVVNSGNDWEAVTKTVYTLLKEIAKEQRYACVDNINKQKKDTFDISLVQHLVLNADIKEK